MNRNTKPRKQNTMHTVVMGDRVTVVLVAASPRRLSRAWSITGTSFGSISIFY